MTVKTVALGYSGGLDTSCAIPWLRETYGCQVLAVIVDVGQGEDLDAVRKKALADCEGTMWGRYWSCSRSGDQL